MTSNNSFSASLTTIRCSYPSSRECLQRWQTLLNITCGALELPKCVLTLLVYSFDQSYKAKKQRKHPIGIPLLLHNNDIQGTCLVNMPATLHFVDIRRQEPSKGTRLPGVRAAANGNFSDEYAYRLDSTRAKHWQLKYARFITWDLNFGYCLPITTCFDKQCNQIQSPFYQIALPKSGMNRHMPKAVIHGPS